MSGFHSGLDLLTNKSSEKFVVGIRVCDRLFATLSSSTTRFCGYTCAGNVIRAYEACGLVITSDRTLTRHINYVHSCRPVTTIEAFGG